MKKTTKSYAQHAEYAAIDMEAREMVSRFDRLSKISDEIELGIGFQEINLDADPAETPVEEDEDPEVRHVADFWIRNHWSPTDAAEVAAERAAVTTRLEEVA